MCKQYDWKGWVGKMVGDDWATSRARYEEEPAGVLDLWLGRGGGDATPSPLTVILCSGLRASALGVAVVLWRRYTTGL